MVSSYKLMPESLYLLVVVSIHIDGVDSWIWCRFIKIVVLFPINGEADSYINSDVDYFRL